MNVFSITRFLIIVSSVQYFCGTENAIAQTNDCSTQWTWFSQKPGDEGAYPDTHVSYFRYMFKLSERQPIRIKVSGRFPNGRYMGYNIYNPALMDSVAGIADHEISPDAGSDNPYRSGVWNEGSSYSLWFDPHNPEISQGPIIRSTGNDNVASGTREIWYRIYDPKDGPGAYGLVTLPKIEAFDATTGAAVACPEQISIDVPKGPQRLGQARHLPPGPDETGDLHFVHHKGLGLYANRDTHYVAARLKMRDANDEVAIIKFRAPRSAKSLDDLNTPETLDTRYWSFCVGSALSSTTVHCLNDKDAKLDPDGNVTIVIAHRVPENIPQGAHFIERPRGIIPILIYRNLLPSTGFSGDISKIPHWEAGWPGRSDGDEFFADRFIGHHAPLGRVCNQESFKDSRCAIQ